MTLLGEFLRKGVITQDELQEIRDKISREEKSIDEILIKEKGVPAGKVIEIKREYFADIPYRELNIMALDEDLINIFNVGIVRKHKIVPLGYDDDGNLEVGMLNPEDLNAKNILHFISININRGYKIFLISLEYYNHILKMYEGTKGVVTEALEQYISKEEVLANNRNKEKDFDENYISDKDSPISKIVSNIIKGAVEKKASDIHIETTEENILVRYRIDGILYKEIELTKKIQRAVIARIKILSKIKIDEKRKPQDGRFSDIISGKKIDFRVSTFPTFYGEKAVLRLLEQDRGALPIDKIGFNEENLKKIKKIINKPYGIILVCGPTGSGKTNTLYSLLNEIDRDKKNVVSLENPIELNIPGVSQSQIRPEIGYTFASGLRSILRQDPDIIMVGEIRDQETASLAIEASLTGHLVLSTIHTNTASDVPQRLIDMGVKPYLIGPTLIASIGQRLIRKIIPEYREEVDMPDEIREFIKSTVSDLPEEVQRKFLSKNKIYIAREKEDGKPGLKGRTAVFEILETDNEIRKRIIHDPSSLSIYEAARKKGFITFKEDGIEKALNGITTFEEIMKL